MTVLGHACMVSGTKRCVTIGGVASVVACEQQLKEMGGGGEEGG